MSDEQTPMQRWTALLNDAVQRHVDNLQRPIGLNVLKFRVYRELKDIDNRVIPQSLEKWLGGEKLELNQAAYDKLLGILGEHGSSDFDQLAELRTARVEALQSLVSPTPARKPPDRRAVPAPSSKDVFALVPPKGESETLTSLRVHRGNNITSRELDDVLRTTENASEYIACYVLKHYDTYDAAELYTGIGRDAIYAWINRDILPGEASLVMLRQGVTKDGTAKPPFFEKGEDADRFEQLVVANRRLLMVEAKNRSSLGHHLQRTTASFAFDELNAFLASADKLRKEQPGGLITSSGMFRDFLRKALGLTTGGVGERLDIDNTTVANMGKLQLESQFSPKLLNKYEVFLTEELEKFIDEPTEEQKASCYYASNREKAIELQDAMRSKVGKLKIAALDKQRDGVGGPGGAL